jgi:hypothetical protein
MIAPVLRLTPVSARVLPIAGGIAKGFRARSSNVFHTLGESSARARGYGRAAKARGRIEPRGPPMRPGAQKWPIERRPRVSPSTKPKIIGSRPEFFLQTVGAKTDAVLRSGSTLMARYTLLEPGFLQQTGHLQPARYVAGATVVFDGEPGFSMVPLDATARAAKAAAIRKRILHGWNPRQPPASTRHDIFSLNQSIGGPADSTVEEMMTHLEGWLAEHPAP